MKTPNWPNWLRDAIVAAYAENVTVQEIADEIGRTLGQVRAKLVREGVYISQAMKQGRLKEIKAEEQGF
mgnify:CR=1 FL=1